MIFNFSTKNLGWIKIKGSGARTEKLRVTKGARMVTYKIEKNVTLTIPLQFGSGIYEFFIFEQIKKNKYRQKGHRKIDVKLINENEPFLCPNLYIDYDTSFAEAVKERFDGEKDCIKAVKVYILKCFSYDYIRALLKRDVMPDINHCFNTKMGTCQDLAAVAVAMWRVLGIPAKIVIGYADGNYHAWTKYWRNGKWFLFDPTSEILKKKVKGNYKIERWY